MSKYTSTAKFNVILAGVHLTLKESGEKINSIRKLSKGRNFCPVERELRMQLELIKAAVKLTEKHLERHVAPYNEKQSESWGGHTPVEIPQEKEKTTAK